MTGKNVLVVSTVEHPEEFLSAHLGEHDTIKVIVPAVRQGFLDWLANDEKAFAQADRAAERIGDEVPGETAETGPGESDVGLAVRDALATFPAQEIVVIVRPEGPQGFVEAKATKTAPQHSVAGIPVRYVVVPE